MKHTHALADIIPQLHTYLRGCLLHPFTEEWATQVGSFVERVEENIQSLVDYKALQEEMRLTISAGLLNKPGLDQYSNWLRNTLSAPAKDLINVAKEVLRDPYFSPSRKDLRVDIEPPEDVALAEMLGWMLLKETEREALLSLFVKKLRMVCDATSIIRQQAEIEINRIAGTYYERVVRETFETEPISRTGLLTTDSPKTRQQRPATVARYKKIKELVDHYMKIEGYPRPEAMKRAGEKERCSLDTVERAVGFRKR